MLRHMREANAIRSQMGRGPFRRGPKVVGDIIGLYDFGCDDSLEDHPTDTETTPSSYMPRERQTNDAAAGRPARSLRRSRKRRATVLTENVMDINNNVSTAPSSSHRLSSVPRRGLRLGRSHGSAPVEVNRQTDRAISGISPHHNATQGATASPQIPNSGDSFEDDGGDHVDLVDEHPAQATVPYVEDHETLLPDGDYSVSRIPGFRQWLMENVGWVDLFYKHGLTYTAMDYILVLIGSPCRSWKTVISNVTEESGVRVYDFPICPGHMCYATLHGTPEVESCSVCGNEKPPQACYLSGETVSYIPMIPRFRALIADPNLSEQLFSYRETMVPTNGVFRDFFDSDTFKTLLTEHGGSEATKYDIFIAASTDGFQAFKNRSCDVWPLVAVLMNLPPDVRFLAKNVLPLMFIPNDVQPKDLQSFLVPFINEILTSTKKGGIEAYLPNGTSIRFKIHLVWFSGDLAAMVKLAGITGHSGRFPCRFCLIQGYYSSDHQHYYYPTLLMPSEEEPLRTLYDPRNLAERTPEHTELVFERLDAARTVTEKKRIATETGVKSRSVLFALPDLKPFTCFPPDIMHLFYNVGMELMRHHLSEINEGFALDPSIVEFLDKELVNFASGISGQLSTKPRPLSCFATWKAAEHKVFTLSYSLVLFDGYLEKQCLDGLHIFVMLVDICFQSSVTASQADEVKRLSVRFIKHFESYYVKHDRTRVNFCKYVIHLLLHLGDAIKRYGPLISASQYWVEKYIGWISGRTNARVLPAKSMLQSAWFGEAKKIFFSQRFHELRSSFSEVADRGGCMFHGPKRSVKLTEVNSDVGLLALVASYLVRKYEGMATTTAQSIANNIDFVSLWSRVQFVCGLDTQTASCAKPVDDTLRMQEARRPSCCVSVEMDENENTVDVYYGKILHLLELRIERDEGSDASTSHFTGHYKLAVIRWVNGLSVGAQGQVYKVGSRDSAFGMTTIEDVSIIRRLIGVVEHAVPARNSTSSQRIRQRQQTYFIDDFQRIDHLLSQTKVSDDGFNRILRGVRR